MRSIRIATALACACAVVPLLAQQIPMQPGNWETTVQMDMPNMPVKMPEMKATQCVTQADIDNPARLASVPGGDSCKVTDQKVDGNKVTWKMTCTGQMAITGDGELLFDGDTYKGTINSTTDQGSMTLRMAGKRVGSC